VIASVLVVDDNPDIVEGVRAIFESYDPELTLSAAGSGKAALEMMGKATPDIVLLDIMMPGMNGWEVAARMKLEPAMKQIPIVYFTAKADELSRLMGGISAEDFIVKPFAPKELMDKVHGVLEKRRAKPTA
jgi:CheY-like chemotaxis protein